LPRGRPGSGPRARVPPVRAPVPCVAPSGPRLAPKTTGGLRRAVRHGRLWPHLNVPLWGTALPDEALGSQFTKLPTEWPAAPSRSQTAFHHDAPTAHAALTCHQNPCVTRNVCLLAPLRRPIPSATAGVIIGRFAKSASCAMPLFAARSYQ